MIDGRIFGDDKAIAMLRNVPERAQAELRDTVGRCALRLRRMVMESKLSGQVLKVRTGNLRRGIDSAIFERPGEVIGKVSTNVKYARVHEYGYNGTVSVKAHLRQVKQAWGRTLATPITANVRAFTRKVNFPERSFLRSSLDEFKPQFIAEVQAAVHKVAGSSK